LDYNECADGFSQELCALVKTGLIRVYSIQAVHPLARDGYSPGDGCCCCWYPMPAGTFARGSGWEHPGYIPGCSGSDMCMLFQAIDPLGEDPDSPDEQYLDLAFNVWQEKLMNFQGDTPYATPDGGVTRYYPECQTANLAIHYFGPSINEHESNTMCQALR